MQPKALTAGSSPYRDTSHKYSYSATGRNSVRSQPKSLRINVRISERGVEGSWYPLRRKETLGRGQWSFSGQKRPSNEASYADICKTNIPPETSTSRNIPRFLSFIFRIEPLSPNYDKQSRQVTATGAWAPPNRRDGYDSTPGTFWRWQGGRVTQIPSSDPCLRAGLRIFEVASLFSQDPDTPHLLVVPFDVRARDVRGYGRGWLPITFDHARINNAGGAREYYSSVSAMGGETHIAAPGQGFWMPQLLPLWYNYRPPPNSLPRTHAGLIGNLPILLALAVFSAPAVNLAEAMSSLQPGAWSPHRHPYPSGRTSHYLRFTSSSCSLLPDTIGERGVVVSVFFDPNNPEHSTREFLQQLQNGDFGAFYGRLPGSSPPSGSSSAGSSYSPGPSKPPYNTSGYYRSP